MTPREIPYTRPGREELDPEASELEYDPTPVAPEAPEAQMMTEEDFLAEFRRRTGGADLIAGFETELLLATMHPEPTPLSPTSEDAGPVEPDHLAEGEDDDESDNVENSGLPNDGLLSEIEIQPSSEGEGPPTPLRPGSPADPRGALRGTPFWFPYSHDAGIGPRALQFTRPLRREVDDAEQERLETLERYIEFVMNHHDIPPETRTALLNMRDIVLDWLELWCTDFTEHESALR